MSEEDYYIDILKDEEEKEPKKQEEFSWGSESQPYEEKQPDYSQQDYSQEEQPYQREFYGEGYYQDYEAARRPTDEKGTPWFWIGILIGIGVSAVVMVIFNFTGTSFHPGLAFLEIILLLVCCMLPGLFVRKIGKGILGGLMIFGLQFFVPLIVFYATGQNPTSLFSPYLIFLNALGLIKMGIKDIFGFSFVPITPEIEGYYNQYSGYATFVWVFDLLIMFGIMITLVIASSWMFTNLFTDKAKSFWTWCLLPGQAIFIILNLIVVPWILLCFSSTIQTGGALAAGAANVAEAGMPIIQGNITDFESINFDDILTLFDRADEWFEIARGNYDGLNSLLFFRLLTAVSGPYGFAVDIFNLTIAAGFELLAALNPLAHGLFDNTNTSENAEVDGFYYQFQDFMEIYDTFPEMFNFTGGGGKPTETHLSNTEAEVDGIIDNVDILLNTHIVDVLDHIIKAEEILLSIDPDDLRNVGGNAQVQTVLNQVADQLDMIMNVTKEYAALAPLAVDLLMESPHIIKAMLNMLIGNVRLLMGWQFTLSQQYFYNASAELETINAIFNSDRRLEVEESGSKTAMGFFDFMNDTLTMANPTIMLEGDLAQMLGGIVHALDEYETNPDPLIDECDFDLVNFTRVFEIMDEATIFSDLGVQHGNLAAYMIDVINNRANQSDYSIMSGPAQMMTDSLATAFQPAEFAQVMSNMTRAVNHTYALGYHVWNNDSTGFNQSLAIAQSNIDAALTVVDENPDTPVYALREFLIVYNNSISDIRDTVEPHYANLKLAEGLIEVIFLNLWNMIHEIVDEGLPP
ncbi:MAG: hypothetical protein HZR80_11760 [Candidatus Heimdallarchaeota archaeon]